MRLDSYLVENRSFSSRGRAKRAITQGYVRVNEIVVTKPSFDVAYSDKIKVVDDMDKPAGYWKLKEIQERSNIIKQGDRVLDIGCSAGGFLMFASEIAYHVHGIEFSKEFASELERIVKQRSNVTIQYGDVFSITLEKERFDVLLFDITTTPSSSIKALENVLPALKKEGRALLVFKTSKEGDIKALLKKLCSLSLEITEIIKPEKQEIYVIAKRCDGDRYRADHQNYKK